MKPSLTDTLCTRCGLCCDGSLFADVELAGPSEAAGLEAMGLVVEDDSDGGEVMALPCGALRGKLCSIYKHRPKCCRTFECRLLKDARRGAVTVEQAMEHITDALTRIGRVRKLALELGQRDGSLTIKERSSEALALAGTNPALARKCAELKSEMSAVDTLIRKRFLAGNF